jgi:hypothetical protein
MATLESRPAAPGPARTRTYALRRFPLMAPVADEVGVLELSIVRYPYKLYYELSRNEEVWILHIRDTQRTRLG